MKTYLEYKGFKANQIVLDANNTLARIIYFEVDESMNEKYNKDISLVRLGLIDHNGFEFANCSNLVDQIKVYELINKPVTTTNEQPDYTVKVDEKIFELTYAEMVEIFTIFRHKLKGNEAYESAMIKAKEIFEHLPITDY